MRVLITLLLGLLGASVAQANCGGESGVRSVGEETAWTLSHDSTLVQIPGGIGCTSIGTDQAYMRVRVSSEDSTLIHEGNAHGIEYSVRSDSTGTGHLDVGVWKELISGQPSAGGLFNASGQFPLYIQVSGNSSLGSLAPGIYTGNVTLEYQYSIPLPDGTFATTGVTRPAGATNLDWGSGVETVLLTLQLVVLPSCNIAEVNHVDFGNQPLVRRFDAHQLQIIVDCSANTLFEMHLDNGQNADADGTRRMISPAGNYLPYDVYKDDGARWGVDDASWSASYTKRIYVGNAKILGTQTPPEGDYTDTLRVEVVIP